MGCWGELNSLRAMWKCWRGQCVLVLRVIFRICGRPITKPWLRPWLPRALSVKSLWPMKLSLISVGTPYNGLYGGGTLERVYFSQPYYIRKDGLIFVYSFLYRNGPREDRKKVRLWFTNMISMRSNEKGIYQFTPHKSKDSCSLHNWQIFVPEDLKYLPEI